jgi:hypothetical protein
MATITYKSFLMYDSSTSGAAVWSKVVDIKDYPDLGGAPDMVETTTLSDKQRTNIMGLQASDSMSFTANYTKEEYQAIKALEGAEKKFAVWFGATENAGVLTPTGTDGKFAFPGTLSVYLTGKGVNDVREMVITIAASAPVAYQS